MHLPIRPSRFWIPIVGVFGFALGAAAASADKGGAPAEERLTRGVESHAEQEQQRVRRATGAGRWYPANAERLREAVDGYISANPAVVPSKPLALIVPHAGYDYSGAVAGSTYSTLSGFEYRRVILLGLSHGVLLRGASVLSVDSYQTPLGNIQVDADARDELLNNRVVSEQPEAHRNEHSAENQLPMLQRALDDFELVEMLVGEMTDAQREALARTVRDLIDEETLIVVSTDFTHYGPNFGYTPFRDHVPERLQMLNDAAVQEILEVDVPGWESFLENTRATICGRNPVSLLLETLLPYDDLEGRRVAYATSGELTGDYVNSVTYAGVVFWRIGEGLDNNEQQTVLQLARNTVTEFLTNGPADAVDTDGYDLTPRLESLGAAFVTLRNDGQLRGCIGHIIAVRPLYMSVVENAQQACVDPRFTSMPVTIDEVSDLDIEISVLTPMRRLLDPNDVRVGTDGLLIVRGRNHGVLLPQVPVEEGWNQEQFLVAACLKAGLPADAWRDQQTEIYRFSAQVFGEAEHDLEHQSSR